MRSNRLRQCLTTLSLFSILLIAVAAPAQESAVAYPLLPTVQYRSIKVFDRQSRFVGRLLPDKRYWTPIERIPLFLQKAVVAVEDSRFYEHGGVDLRGIARAAVKNVVKRRMAEGGSTITQQLIKNKYLTAEKSLDRKVNEAMLALEFEKKYSKRQILEMYLNEIYYGNGAWGIAQAARVYFDKYPEELSEAECSLLAGIPKNPGRYNPLGKPADVAKRRSIVLNRMVELGMLSTRQLKQLYAQPAAAVQASQAPWYLTLLRTLLVERYGPTVIDSGGLEITAALDLPMQLSAEKILREEVRRRSPQLQGALVAIDPQTGDLLAAVGGTDFAHSQYNRAIHARRQPGSAIKPLIYATALEQGATAADLWDDQPVSYPHGNGAGWRPHNYDRISHGRMSLRQALASSNNVIAVKLLDTLGLATFSEQAARLGLPLKATHDLSLALGTEEVSLHELTAAYVPLAAGGLRPEPRSIVRIYDSSRNQWSEQAPHSSVALSPATAFLATDMLKDVLTSGTAKGLRRFAQQYPSAGKTGTTNDYRDAWFIGYTPQLVAGVWVGHDQPRPGGPGFTGGAVAAPVWERFMRAALAGRPRVDFSRPPDIVSVTIDPQSGQLAGPNCPNRRTEQYQRGSEPGDNCPLHPVRPPADQTTTTLPQP